MPTVSAGTLQNLSIRTKLSLLVASVVVIPGLVYGALAVANGRVALVRASSLQLASEAQNVADRLATALRSERDTLAAAAHQDVMREIRVGDLDKRIASFLVTVQRGCAACRELFVLDERGTVVAATDPGRIGRNGLPDDAPTNRPAIAGPSIDPEGQRATLQLTATILDPDVPDRRLGWLVARLDWERVTEAATRTRTNLARADIDADVLVVDTGGMVIGGVARPDGPWPRGTRIPSVATEVHASEPGARADDAAGVLLGRAPLPDDLPRWTVVIAQPLAQALAPVRRTAELLAAALAVTLALALVAALVAAHRMTRPLGELTAAAGDIGQGGAVAPIPVRSGDEIGTLAAAFNRMATELAQAERRLVDAAKFAFVGELAAGVAHEVRTPLGVLRSSTQLLERSLTAPDAEARELLELVRDEVDRIEGVVSGLLELGRPRTLRLESAPLGPIVARAADFVDVQARTNGVAIARRLAAPDPPVTCDPELVYQVALNLLVNAVQILPAGGHVEVSLLPPSDTHAGFAVRDDGPGIPADLRPNLFQPFATGREGGIGLGLTFVQHVVLEHHGRLAVEDAPGGGALFRVELPRAEERP